MAAAPSASNPRSRAKPLIRDQGGASAASVLPTVVPLSSRRRTPAPKPAPYPEMIQKAIRDLAEEGGSTVAEIEECIRKAFPDGGLPRLHRTMFPYYLRKLILEGELRESRSGRIFIPRAGATMGKGTRGVATASAASRSRRRLQDAGGLIEPKNLQSELAVLDEKEADEAASDPRPQQTVNETSDAAVEVVAAAATLPKRRGRAISKRKKPDDAGGNEAVRPETPNPPPKRQVRARKQQEPATTVDAGGNEAVRPETPNPPPKRQVRSRKQQPPAAAVDAATPVDDLNVVNNKAPAPKRQVRPRKKRGSPDVEDTTTAADDVVAPVVEISSDSSAKPVAKRRGRAPPSRKARGGCKGAEAQTEVTAASTAPGSTVVDIHKGTAKSDFPPAPIPEEEEGPKRRSRAAASGKQTKAAEAQTQATAAATTAEYKDHRTSSADAKESGVNAGTGKRRRQPAKSQKKPDAEVEPVAATDAGGSGMSEVTTTGGRPPAAPRGRQRSRGQKEAAGKDEPVLPNAGGGGDSSINSDEGPSMEKPKMERQPSRAARNNRKAPTSKQVEPTAPENTTEVEATGAAVETIKSGEGSPVAKPKRQRQPSRVARNSRKESTAEPDEPIAPENAAKEEATAAARESNGYDAPVKAKPEATGASVETIKSGKGSLVAKRKRQRQPSRAARNSRKEPTAEPEEPTAPENAAKAARESNGYDAPVKAKPEATGAAVETIKSGEGSPVAKRKRQRQPSRAARNSRKEPTEEPEEPTAPENAAKEEATAADRESSGYDAPVKAKPRVRNTKRAAVHKDTEVDQVPVPAADGKAEQESSSGAAAKGRQRGRRSAKQSTDDTNAAVEVRTRRGRTASK